MDYLIFKYINGFALKYFLLDALGIFLAKYLIYILIAIFVLFLIKNFRKYLRMVFFTFLAVGLGGIVTGIIRFFWYRPRPFVENQVNLLLPHAPTASFPSGHTVIAFALSAAFVLFCKKIQPRPKFWWWAGTLFLIASTLIGLARIFVGVHWPFDILGGAVVGLFSGWFVYRIFRK